MFASKYKLVWEPCSDRCPASFVGRQRFFNKDPTIWLNGARPPPKVCLQSSRSDSI